MARLNVGAQPFVKWQGGKGQHLLILNQALPTDFADIPNVTYIEPFVGGGAMLFHMLQTYPNITRAVINDNNLDLMRVYNTVRDRSAELIVALKRIQKEFLPLSEEKRREYFEQARKQFDQHLTDGIHHASLFLFLNKTSVNGLGQKYHHSQKPVICEEAVLQADAKVLHRVTIMCDDYEKTYNEACGNSFFFLDPPYRPAHKAKPGEWGDKEQVRLKKFCDLLNFRHFQWMLTNSDGKAKDPSDDFMDQLYGNYDIQRIWSQQAIVAKPEKREKQSEILVRNFDREILSLRDLRCQQLTLAF
ncbi:MAG: Dam family site-specific DNA-(adenine-N6)-methyltransferase [Bacteroidaceae bacterium]|nr:Dam family site-specific DNA-(adenine-N6)-methyltransferase [Bacteroidaceae bacterium]